MFVAYTIYILFKSSMLLDSSCSMAVPAGATSHGAVWSSSGSTKSCSCSANCGARNTGSSMYCYMDIVECSEQNIP